ncbi:hypothetical protein N7499_010279 [Penicillium canescens]|nr:hypothetical protein N7499_010279 [Penicillium canescens]
MAFSVGSDETRPQSYFTSLEVRNEYRNSIPGSTEFAKSTTIYHRSHRTSQLSDLIQRCVQLKQSLECQDGAYIFRRSHPRMPFRDENMRSLVEEVGSNDTVEYSVWPGLYQILQPGNWAVVEKEIVKTTSSRIDTLSMTDEPEGRSEEQWLEEI